MRSAPRWSAREFPKGPPSIANEVLKEFNTIHAGDRLLVVLMPTDSVRDRLTHYFYWNDHTALAAAVAVATAKRAAVDLGCVKEWTAAIAEDSKIEYPDIATKTRRFFSAVETQLSR